MMTDSLNFEGQNLRSRNFVREAKRGGNNFLRGVDFCKANLQGAKFRGLDLSEANFGGAYIRSANFKGTILKRPFMSDI